MSQPQLSAPPGSRHGDVRGTDERISVGPVALLNCSIVASGKTPVNRASGVSAKGTVSGHLCW
jgi:hypothetical protein